MSTTVSYKGSTIATLSNETKTLTTAGTWVEGDIVVTDSGGTAAISVVDTTDSHGGTIREITAIDISDTTAIASDVAVGKYFYTASGVKTAGTGSGSGGGSSSYTRTTIASEQTVTPTSTTSSGNTYYSAQLNLSSGLESGEEYIITYNGTEYFYTCTVLWGTNYLLGEINYLYGETGLPYPFGIIWMSGNTCRMACGDSTAVTIKIEKLEFVETSTDTWETIFNDYTVVFADSGGFDLSNTASNLPNPLFNANETWRVTIGYDEYVCETFSVGNTYLIGNVNIFNDNDDGTGVPFYIADYSWGKPGKVRTIPQENTYTLIKLEKLVDRLTNQHTIYFEFSDETNTTITAYYDDSFISNAITATTPTTYDSKTVTLAQLDSVTWYEASDIPLNTELVDYTSVKTGYIVENNGEIVADESWKCVTDYIPIDPSMTFTFKLSNYDNVGFYDSNKNMVRVISSDFLVEEVVGNYAIGTLNSTNIPSNAAYIVIPGNSYDLQSSLSLIRTA